MSVKQVSTIACLSIVAFALLAAGREDDTLPAQLVSNLHDAFGQHHARAVHAKGIVVEGSFVPSKDATSITRATLFETPSRVIARFSDFTGLPDIPDTDPNANPRGFAVKFTGLDGTETDVVTHSVNGFPVATAQEFGALMQAIGLSAHAQAKPTPLDGFLASHPAALSFLTSPKPLPESYATQLYFAVNAFRFVDRKGAAHLVRTRFLPEAGTHALSPTEAEHCAPDYLAREITARLARSPARFVWVAQLAAVGDPTDDPSRVWPENRRQVTLGTVTLDHVAADQAGASKDLMFLPSRVPVGIEAADPMIDIRSAAYPISFAERQ